MPLKPETLLRYRDTQGKLHETALQCAHWNLRLACSDMQATMATQTDLNTLDQAAQRLITAASNFQHHLTDETELNPHDVPSLR